MSKCGSLALLAVFFAAGAPAETLDPLARGQAAWAGRAESHNGSQADPGPIGEAVRAFEDARSADPEDLAALAQLLRALWFQGEHTPLDDEAKLRVFEYGRDLAQHAIDTLTSDLSTRDGKPTSEEIAAHVRDTESAGEIYFWAAAHWGLWGRHRGKIASARQGVAGKIRDYAEVTIALDERLQNAGGRRILGRLHTEAPKLPFVTGWIDRREAIRHLERAVELAPEDLMNRLYLLEALIEFDSARRPDAIRQLRQLVEQEPQPSTIVEDLKILEDARELLERAD
ncbi:MAG: hypothetical protein OEM62_11240 [Acidobacteriota bacterium]|nr:hypothetical protein [Acidobacteriota bacterium]